MFKAKYFFVKKENMLWKTCQADESTKYRDTGDRY